MLVRRKQIATTKNQSKNCEWFHFVAFMAGLPYTDRQPRSGIYSKLNHTIGVYMHSWKDNICNEEIHIQSIAQVPGEASNVFWAISTNGITAAATNRCLKKQAILAEASTGSLGRLLRCVRSLHRRPQITAAAVRTMNASVVWPLTG